MFPQYSSGGAGDKGRRAHGLRRDQLCVPRLKNIGSLARMTASHDPERGVGRLARTDSNAAKEAEPDPAWVPVPRLKNIGSLARMSASRDPGGGAVRTGLSAKDDSVMAEPRIRTVAANARRVKWCLDMVSTSVNSMVGMAGGRPSHSRFSDSGQGVVVHRPTSAGAPFRGTAEVRGADDSAR